MSLLLIERTSELVIRDVYQPDLKPRSDNWETAIARVLSKRRIKWLYEPHEFELNRSSDGHINFAFRPDFWLPDLDIYIEVTGRDRGLEGKHGEECAEALSKKRHRIAETRRIHQKQVILMISSTCQKVQAAPKYLDLLIQRAIAA
jgi:hypothetical protein